MVTIHYNESNKIKYNQDIKYYTSNNKVSRLDIDNTLMVVHGLAPNIIWEQESNLWYTDVVMWRNDWEIITYRGWNTQLSSKKKYFSCFCYACDYVK